MTKLTLSVRLVLLLALPLAGVAVFGVYGAIERWSTRQSYAQVRSSGAALEQMGNVIYELQRERGRAAVFIGTRGQKFATELSRQQTETDAAIAKFHELRRQVDEDALGADFRAALQQGLTALAQLGEKRKATAAFTLAAVDSTKYFTSTIAELLDVIVVMSHTVDDARVANGIGCYVSFVQVKEQAGIERAILSGVFSADAFTGDALQRLNQAIAGQDSYLRLFHDLATKEQEQVFTDIVRGAPVELAASMRKTALERSTTGGFKVDPSAWFDAITAKMDLMKKVEDRLAADYGAAAIQREREAQRSFIGYTVVTSAIFILTALFGVWVMRSISGPLRRIIQELGANANQTSAASSQVSESSQSLAAGSSEQASRLEETSAALAEMAAMTKRNAESAARAKEFSHQTRASADAGARHVEEMRRAMDAMKASSDGISKIIKTIDEIAFQTNILALNAAVEAARAGDAGMGFAVVAEEVRNLAQRSATSAKETAVKIEDAIQRSEHGVQISANVAQALGDILEKAHKVDSFIAEIAEASSQQSRGTEQVNEAVSRMDQITQANASNAEETAAAAEELSAQASSLNDSVASLAQLVSGETARAAADFAAPNSEQSFATPPVRPVVGRIASRNTISRPQSRRFSLKPAPAVAEVN